MTNIVNSTCVLLDLLNRFTYFIAYISYVCSVGSNLFATPRTVACQAPLSREFSRQEHQSGLPFPPPGDLPHPGGQGEESLFHLLHWQVDSLPLHHLGNPYSIYICIIYMCVAAPGLMLRLVGSLVVAVSGILFPDQGWNPGPLHWELGVLAPGPPGKS